MADEKPNKRATRKEVGLKPAKRKFDLPGYPVDIVYIHHGASGFPSDLGDRDGDGVPDGEEAVWRAYQNYHMDTKGWSDIAYNFGVSQSGIVFGGRGWTRQGGATGSPHDTRSISICAIGNFEKRGPSKQLKNAIVRLIVNGVRAGHLKENVDIRGHKDASGQKTSCPGSKLYAALDEIQTAVDRELAGLTAPPPPTQEDRLAALERRVAALEGRLEG